MEYQFRVYERDIDLLLARLFSENHPACDLFYQFISPKPETVKINKVVQSSYGPFGESDLEIYLDADGKSVVLLIEDKINAPAQKNQFERYEKRKASLHNAEVYIILVAPKTYLSSAQAEGYINKVSYEKLMSCFNELDFSYQLLKRGCEKQENGKVVDERVTAYWRHYREFCHSYNDRTGANLRLIESVDERTSQGQWLEYRTSIPRCHVVHKTDRGFADLEIPGQAKNIDSITEQLKTPLAWANIGQEKKIHIVPAKKSLALRIEGLGVLPMTEEFDAKAQNLEYIFDQIRRLSDFATVLKEQGYSFP